MKYTLKGEAKTGRVWLDGLELSAAKSQGIVNHSPDGFNWGYGGSGPAQLALAILLDITNDVDIATAEYQDFKWHFITTLPQGKDFEVEFDY